MRRRAVPGVGEAVGGVEPGQIGPSGQVRVEGRTLDQCADPAQCRWDLRRRRRAEQRDLPGASERSGPAASGWWWSCPSRSGRGSRRPRRAAPSDRRRRPRAGTGTAWSAHGSRPGRVSVGPRWSAAVVTHVEARTSAFGRSPLERGVQQLGLHRAGGHPAVVGEHDRERRAGEHPTRAPVTLAPAAAAGAGHRSRPLVTRAEGAAEPALLTTTVVQPLPTIFGASASSAAAPLPRSASAFFSAALLPAESASGLTSVTLAPGGGLKANCPSSGTLKSISVKPTSATGSVPSAKTRTRSGTDFSPSTAIRTSVIRLRSSLGRSTSSYAARPATSTSLSVATSVVGPTADRNRSAASCGVFGRSVGALLSASSVFWAAPAPPGRSCGGWPRCRRWTRSRRRFRS